MKLCWLKGHKWEADPELARTYWATPLNKPPEDARHCKRCDVRQVLREGRWGKVNELAQTNYELALIRFRILEHRKPIEEMFRRSRGSE